MTRALLVLANDAIRARAAAWIASAPKDTRVEFKAPRRSTDQNSLMWALLTDIARQKEHCGRRYQPEEWRYLFLHALGRSAQFVPSLDEKTFVPIGQSSSDLSKEEFSNLIELIYQWGAEQHVVFNDGSADPPMLAGEERA
jgi:uncharacterized protein YecE (DUF72 family)